MAEDYLTDDEQWEAVKRWMATNGVWIAAGVALGAALLFGWRYYQTHENEVALKAAGQFGEMTTALEHNDRNRSRQLANGLVKDFPGSAYADQAQLTLARLFVDDGQMPSAVGPLTQVMNHSKDTELRHIARLRLARVLIGQGKPDDALKILAEDTVGTAGYGAFAGHAHEVRGDALYAKKDFKSAVTEYRTALIGGAGSSADAALLELKIADLGAAPAPAPAATLMPAPAAAPPPPNEAKP